MENPSQHQFTVFDTLGPHSRPRRWSHPASQADVSATICAANTKERAAASNSGLANIARILSGSSRGCRSRSFRHELARAHASPTAKPATPRDLLQAIPAPPGSSVPGSHQAGQRLEHGAVASRQATCRGGVPSEVQYARLLRYQASPRFTA